MSAPTYSRSVEPLSGATFAVSAEPQDLVELWNPRRNSVADNLARQPQGFDFFQAVLVLERIQHRGDATTEQIPEKPIGRFHRFDQEGLRISAPATSAFPTAQIESLTIDSVQRPRMQVNFMGLTGPSGMLPRSYTQLLAQVNRDGRGDERYALRDFLDQFNHRLISLFFVAWTKYRFPVRVLREGRGETLMEIALSAVGGLPTTVRNLPDGDAASITRDQFLGFAGLLAQRPATAGNLQAILCRILAVPVRVRQFQPSVLELDESSQTCLGVDNGCGILGVSAVVGPRTMTRQHKIRIEVGPLTYSQFLDFLPGDPGDQTGAGYRALAEIVRTFIGHSLEYDLQLQVSSAEVTGCHLGRLTEVEGGSGEGSRLGFDSWLDSETWPEVLCDTILHEAA